jgi:hypothetical protein
MRGGNGQRGGRGEGGGERQRRRHVRHLIPVIGPHIARVNAGSGRWVPKRSATTLNVTATPARDRMQFTGERVQGGCAAAAYGMQTAHAPTAEDELGTGEGGGMLEGRSAAAPLWPSKLQYKALGGITRSCILGSSLGHVPAAHGRCCLCAGAAAPSVLPHATTRMRCSVCFCFCQLIGNRSRFFAMRSSSQLLHMPTRHAPGSREHRKLNNFRHAPCAPAPLGFCMLAQLKVKNGLFIYFLKTQNLNQFSVPACYAHWSLLSQFGCCVGCCLLPPPPPPLPLLLRATISFPRLKPSPAQPPPPPPSPPPFPKLPI